jgi:hypothetical protein
VPQSVEGVEEIQDGYNPATWALEVTNQAAERRVDRDFADVYADSQLHKCAPPPACHPFYPPMMRSAAQRQQVAGAMLYGFFFRQSAGMLVSSVVVHEAFVCTLPHCALGLHAWDLPSAHVISQCPLRLELYP